MHWNWRLAAAVLVIRAAAPAASFSIEQALSAPFPSDLTPSPVGGKVAWVFDEMGARNIWVAEAPQYRGRRITNYRADDGQEITELRWSPDGRAIAYVRGEGLNSKGEYPNPTSDPKGTRQVVAAVAAAGGEPRELAEG